MRILRDFVKEKNRFAAALDCQRGARRAQRVHHRGEQRGKKKNQQDADAALQKRRAVIEYMQNKTVPRLKQRAGDENRIRRDHQARFRIGARNLRFDEIEQERGERSQFLFSDGFIRLWDFEFGHTVDVTRSITT